jgi:16S rRNA (guanine527-N7)-methyltransferase
MWPENLKIPVSREMGEKLAAYHALLLKWQPVINLVAPSTLADAAIRHFADSAQIVQYIPEGVKVMADLGSGAGFPGLVIAMMRPEIEMHLVESDERKAEFLRTVSRETGTPVKVHADRLVRVMNDIDPDWVTARAMADLRKLLIYVEPWGLGNPGFTALFMKGARADEEIAEAHKSIQFDVKAYASLTDGQAKILEITNILKAKKRA